VERARSVAAAASLRQSRDDAMQAHAALDAALATLDDRRLAEHKDQARRSYRMALSRARNAVERQRAATTWLQRIDELNRSSRGALGQVLMLRARCETLDQQVRDWSMAANVQRVRSEAAEANCIDARQQLAELDRWAADPETTVVVPVSWASDAPPMAPLPMGAVGRAEVRDARALAVERLLARDVYATRQLAQQIAELTGQQPSRCLLLLQMLAETIVESAIGRGYVRVDRSHRLWSQLNVAECRNLLLALRDLGFRYDPDDGWYGDRVPQSRDLALALAYSGVEAHALRRLPTTDELRDLPASISVVPLEHLAEAAPDLDLDHVHALAGRHARELNDLWDNWADVRALLLGPARWPSRPEPRSSGATRAASADVDDPERLDRADAESTGFLRRPGPDPLLELVRLSKLADVLAQRRDLGLERARDVHPGIRLVREEQVQPGHAVGIEAFIDHQLGKGHGVAGGRVDRVHGGHRRRTVVGVLDMPLGVDDHGGVHRRDRVRPEGAQ